MPIPIAQNSAGVGSANTWLLPYGSGIYRAAAAGGTLSICKALRGARLVHTRYRLNHEHVEYTVFICLPQLNGPRKHVKKIHTNAELRYYVIDQLQEQI